MFGLRDSGTLKATLSSPATTCGRSRKTAIRAPPSALRHVLSNSLLKKLRSVFRPSRVFWSPALNTTIPDFSQGMSGHALSTYSRPTRQESRAPSGTMLLKKVGMVGASSTYLQKIPIVAHMGLVT